MKRILTFLVLGILFLVGCGNQNPTVSQGKTVSADSNTHHHNFVTFQQAQAVVPFPISLPYDLPHGMVFDHAMIERDPNNGKANEVLLNFTSPDKNWSIEVNEQAGSSVGEFANGMKIENINGYKAYFSSDDKFAALQWTNGDVSFETVTSSKVDFGTEQGLIDLARKFR